MNFTDFIEIDSEKQAWSMRTYQHMCRGAAFDNLVDAKLCRMLGKDKKADKHAKKVTKLLVKADMLEVLIKEVELNGGKNN